MAKRVILTFDDAALHKKCRAVEKFDDKLAALLDDMAETMYAAEGVGLAAPQIGVLRKVFVIDIGEGLIEAINPEVIEERGEQGGYEGCLSLPGERAYVVRPNYVKMRAFDRHGEPFEFEGEELLARAMLHENDHLSGLVYTRLASTPPKGFEEEEED